MNSGLGRFGIALFFAGVVVSGAYGQSYPTRPIQLIVPYDAGSSTDVVARAMQPTLTAMLGQSVVVLNKPGASSTMGSSALASAKPDGYTIGILGMGGTVMVPHFRKLTYDLDSFELICQIYSAPVVVMVAPKSPYKDIGALIAWGRANPGKAFYGSPGIGTPDHINTATFFRMSGVKATHVPFQGGGAAVTALISDQISVLANTTVALKAHQLRPLAVLAPQRLPDLPDVPTAKEIAVPFEASIWAVLAAPRGLPPPVKSALENACSDMLKDPKYRDFAERAGFPPRFRGGEELKQFVTSEYDRYGAMIKAEGIEMQ
jgi:tripartite-type tricarboxylate transporter receptor subunit TctC